jgi:hypothetical protein
VIAIGQNKTREGIRMLFENSTEIRDLHGDIYMPLKEYNKARQKDSLVALACPR